MSMRALLRGTGALLMAANATVAAQPPAFGSSYAIAAYHHSDSNLDAGGEAGFTGIFASLGGSRAVGDRSALGIRLTFDYRDWSFSAPSGFGGTVPWGEIHRFAVSLPFTLVGESSWVWTVTPTVGYSGEPGASSSDAIEFGATLAVAQRPRPDLLLGLGIGVFDRIEKTSVYPFLLIDWRIDERWRVSNPVPAGPAGPAGLELAYTFPGGWHTGLAVAYRSSRYRLDRAGPFPGGVGEHRTIPVIARIGRDVAGSTRLDFYVGTEAGTRLRVGDRDGSHLFSDQQDPAPVLGVSLTGRF